MLGKRTAIPLLPGILLAAASVFAQTNAPSSKTFDAISIHPTDPAVTTEDLNINPNGITTKGATLLFLIESAYGIHDYQISGMPKNLQSTRWDISAKMLNAANEGDLSWSTPANKARAQSLLQERLQSLLADRFQLKVHTFVKEGQVFSLDQSDRHVMLHSSKGSGTYMRMHGVAGGTEIEAANQDMAALASELSRVVARPVLDETGIQGSYDYKIIWAADTLSDASATAPSLYTALTETLGLKLRSQKGPVTMYAIDHLEMPSPN